MKSRGPHLAKGERRAIAAALLSLLLASCTSAGDPGLNAALPGYAAGPTDFSHPTAGASTASADSPPSTEAPASIEAAIAAAANADATVPAGTPAPATAQASANAEEDMPLPQAVAYLPSASPGANFSVPAPSEAAALAANTPPALEPAQAAAEPAETVAAQNVPAPQPRPQAEPAAPEMNHPVYVTAGEAPPPAAAPKKKGFLASLFGSAPAQAAPQQAKAAAKAPDAQPVKPIITLASTEPGAKPLALASLGSGPSSTGDALPGVRQTALFEIKRKSGIDDDSDVDLNEDEGGLYQVASAAGMARLAPNGLLMQNEGVDVACLKPSLVRVLKTIEAHYKRKIVVTSGYRDIDRNTRARGAKNSLHMYCAAADIQIAGVSKWDLATYVRSLPGRGGVGTYCHTESVHVDVGPERDWNWRCRRRG